MNAPEMVPGEWIPHDGGPMPEGVPEWVDVLSGGGIGNVECSNMHVDELCWRWTPAGFGVHAWRPHVPATVAEPAPIPDIAPDYRETLSGAAALLQATAEVSDVRAVLATVEVVRGMLAGVVDGGDS